MVRGTLLLTGGSGMVGRNIQDHPLAAKWEILAPPSRALDLTDAAAVSAFMDRHRPDMVVHAAGRVGGIHANLRHPVAFFDDNIAMARNVIMAAYKTGIRQLINIASANMYPRAAPNPLTEDMILTGALDPVTEAYALAKICATRLCQYIQREDEATQYKTLIPCNLYGPHDKFDPSHSHLVPAIIHKMHTAKREGQETIDIWGDGTARREFMYAPDLAEVILKAAGGLEALPDLMNIGLGHDHAINDYYAAVAEVVGWQGKFTHDLSKPVGVQQKLCDITRQTEWGWSAPTSLTEGIEQTYQYYLERVAG